MSTPPAPDSTPSGSPPPQGGANNSGGGNQQRNRGRWRGNGQNRQPSSNGANGRGSAPRPPKPIFKGEIPEMNGHVFECVGERASRPQFAKTMEALHGYVKLKMTYPEDFSSLFRPVMIAPHLEAPAAPVITDASNQVASQLAVFRYQESWKDYNKHATALSSGMANLFAVIWGQCSDGMRAKLKTLGGWDAAFEGNDCYWLLQEIRAIALNFDHTKKLVWSLQDAKLNFLSCTQKGHETVEVYMENLRAWAEAIESYGGSIVEVSQPPGDGRPERVWHNAAREESLAIALIRGANPDRYEGLQIELANALAQGRDCYPTDFTSAYNYLVNYKPPVRSRTQAQRQDNNKAAASGSAATAPPNPSSGTAPTAATAPEVQAMTFAQVGTPVPGDDGILFENIFCVKCKRMGHFANHCPPATKTGTTLFQHGFTLVQFGVSLAQTNSLDLDPYCILLDSQSTVSVFHNADMLSDIRPSGTVLRALTNGGSQESRYVGDFPNLGPVWYNPHSIANILSLAEVRRVCRVTMDTASEPALIVHRLDGSLMRFVESPTGLYIYAPNSSAPVNAYSLLQTVAARKTHFTKREVLAADAARALYRKLGRPSEADFQRILRTNLIRNCPVTPDDAQRALLIYGPDVATLKGKTKRAAAAARVPSTLAVPLPPPILAHHLDITLCADFFFVQQIPFFHSISRDIGYRTVSYCADQTKKNILRQTNRVTRLYEARGFTVQRFHCDNELACIREAILPIHTDVVPADSHVPEVERSIETIKERLRSSVHGLPYKRIPKLMVVELVYEAVRCLNQFPWQHGVSDTLSPTTIVTGHGIPDFTSMRIEFGAYAQVFEDNLPTNTPKSRTLGAIALGPTGNSNGDYAFMSLATGQRITRHSWTELPIPDTAIARVEALASFEGQPLIQDSGLVVEWRPDMPIDDDEYDFDFEPAISPDEDLDSDFLPITADELLDLAPPPTDPFLDGLDQGAHPEYPDPPNAPFYDETFDDGAHDVEVFHDDRTDEGAHDAPDDDGTDEGAHDAPEPNAYTATEADADDPPDTMNAGDDRDADPAPADDEGAYGDPQAIPDENPAPEDAQTNAYNLRPRNTATPNQFLHAIDDPHSGQSYFPPVQLFQMATKNVASYSNPHGVRNCIFALVLTQMSEHAALRKHGQAAEAALKRELQQLDDLTVFTPLRAHDLTHEQRKGALRAINLVKEKRDGSLKGQTVADGSKQRGLYERSQTASPTVSSDALITTLVIDAKEGRDVATCDVAGAYLKAEMDDFVLLKFTGKVVELICQMDCKYAPYVTTEKDKRVLYVQLKKALYGHVKSALLWYSLFSDTLGEMGFVLNPYNQCVANCELNGSQCTIAWYVDDMKISHLDPDVVTAVIRNIESSFGKMTVTRGTEHEFLGMKITYNGDQTVTVDMRGYLEEAISEANMGITHSAATPAKHNLFVVDEGSPPINQPEKDVFHRVAAKLLYVATRGHADILLPVCFLCTRVSKPTQEDQRKLRRVLEYIHGTIDLTYTVGADDVTKFRTWVDASYAVHQDARSHTGGTILVSFGTGGIMCKSSKQKLNTKSSTEAELVGASDYLPNTLWLKMFLEAQGYKVDQTILEQDNESAIKLEKNGRTSAGQKSRHINIRYFWIKDRIKAEGIEIRHCPTLKMIADFFTKPLQGGLFTKLRDVIMGRKHVSTLEDLGLPTSEERVGDSPSRDSPSPNNTGIEEHMTHVQRQERRRSENSKTVTWADVVKGGFESSFSRNNPGVLS